MVEYLKELVSAAGSRVRSPIIGSVVIAFLLINWKEVFFLLFADVRVETRLNHFEVNTNEWELIWLPLIFGIAGAILYPWLSLTGGWIARYPLRLLKEMQSDETQLRKVRELEQSAALQSAKAHFEQANEDRLLAAARRKEEAREISDEAFDDLETERNFLAHERPEFTQIATEIGDLPPDSWQWSIIMGLASNNSGIGELVEFGELSGSQETKLEFHFRGNEPDPLVIGRHRHAKIQFEEALSLLISQGIIESLPDSVDHPEFQITRLGYDVHSYLAGQYP